MRLSLAGDFVAHPQSGWWVLTPCKEGQCTWAGAFRTSEGSRMGALSPSRGLREDYRSPLEAGISSPTDWWVRKTVDDACSIYAKASVVPDSSGSFVRGLSSSSYLLRTHRMACGPRLCGDHTPYSRMGPERGLMRRSYQSACVDPLGRGVFRWGIGRQWWD